MTIPDGFGPASQVFARDYYQWLHNTSWSEQLPADTIHIGSVRTRASDSLVTDSAAAATAYASGIHTYNGGIGVDDDAVPVGTVLEAAKAQGYKTGMVVTSRITHATPASFGSHSYDRDLESIIADQLIGGTPLGHTTDLMLGGGLCFFQPNTTDFPKSCRPDQINAIDQAKDNGYNFFSSRAGFDALDGGKNATLPFMGLFTSSHMSYEVDRNASVEPSLSEMTKTALHALKIASANSDVGFFLMVEGSRIDHAAHSNDAVGHLHDILEWNNAVQAIKDFIDEDEDESTILIGAADHECGGLVAGGQFAGAPEYGWVPSALEPATHSSSYLASKIVAYKGDDLPGFINNTIFPAYGIFDANSTEVNVAVARNASSSFLDVHIAQSLSRRSMVKWTTLGHSSVDVNLIAYGKGSEVLAGNHENVELAQFMIDTLALDVDSITTKLNDVANQDWLDNAVGVMKVVDGKRVGGAVEKRAHQC
ncbi:alkaline phosphatase [Mrakia frigida]|uniref:alkaline phosphatase n=1 Tax=Mrakia frigida TaxID=29902 RepID=UPI003FCC2317